MLIVSTDCNCLPRACLSLTLHAAESTSHSLIAQTIAVQISEGETLSVALFEAEDAKTWRALLNEQHSHLASKESAPSTVQASSSNNILSPTRSEGTFLPSILLSQYMVNLVYLQGINASNSDLAYLCPSISAYYQHMMQLAGRFDILDNAAAHRRYKATELKTLRILWHYGCLVYLTKLNMMEIAAGREGAPSVSELQEIRNWTQTPRARLASLHAGSILQSAEDLRDAAFLIPR